MLGWFEYIWIFISWISCAYISDSFNYFLFMTFIASANPVRISRAIYTSPNLPLPSFRPNSNISSDSYPDIDALSGSRLPTRLRPTKDWFLNLSRGVLGVLTLFSVFITWYSAPLSIFFLKLFYFSTLEATATLPTILFLIFFTMIAPFFSSLSSLFYLSYFFLLALVLEVLSPFAFAFSLKALRLLLEVLVLSAFFLLLLDV